MCIQRIFEMIMMWETGFSDDRHLAQGMFYTEIQCWRNLICMSFALIIDRVDPMIQNPNNTFSIKQHRNGTKH